MRNIIKHPFINLIFFVALFAFSGCTNEMEPDIAGNSNLPADGTPLTVRATASGFQAPAQPGGSPATRTPVMEGTSTKFQTGDAIGLFCVRKNASGTEYISTDIYNLKMTYTAAADGTGTWEAPTAASAPLLYTDAVAYFAYYPYTDALTTASVNNEQDIRNWLKTNKPLATDMLTKEVFTANDLMTAAALPSLADTDRGALTLNFKHEYALLVVKPMVKGVYIVPSGVTAYSYYTGAQSNDWEIDRNVVQGGGDDFKMKINGGKACEMSDGTYRILTEATTVGSQIKCEYLTDEDGLKPVSPNGSNITGGFKSNTCYTLEVHVNVSKVKRTVQPGDFVYQHNGKIEIYPCNGAVDAWGNIPDYRQAVGIVVTTDPARLTDAECNAKGWNHAYVMGLETISGTYSWAKSNIIVTSVIAMNEVENDMNGYKITQIMLAKTPLSDYPAFQAIKEYRDSHAIPNNINRSPWFMPSMGQWFDLMANLGGKSPTAWKDVSASGSWSEYDDASNMFNKINNQLEKVNIDDNVFLPDRAARQSFFCSTSETVANNGVNGLWSLITINDTYNKKRVETVVISAQSKGFGCSIRPFFAF